ncbi:MAG TPA: urate hydroxylase PuuD [Acidimicrobiia bacterium]|nr:urate hydroxylase PuuD [Acidimicrobiia bacterium]
MLAVGLDFFTRDAGAFYSRWSHVLVGVAWIGLLYFFNLVQVPAFAEMEPAARNNTMDKLTWRALWWFRWAALATVVTGILLLIFQEQFKGDYMKTAPGISISAGVLLGLTMFVNVWGIIWPKQKVVIGNARAVQAGGEADPAAPEAGRRALLASRMNTIFSLPLLLFMVGTSHFPYSSELDTSGSKRALFWGIFLVVWALMELNALGLLGGIKAGGARLMFDTHRNAVCTGLVYTAFSVLLFAFVLSS